jgi:arsenical pump membrane protein
LKKRTKKLLVRFARLLNGPRPKVSKVFLLLFVHKKKALLPILAGMIVVIVVISIAGVIFRPFGVREVVWACGGAVALVVLGLLPWRLAVQGVGQGGDVYLFLAGMMLLSELARDEGVFGWLAGLVARWARGSAVRLFGLVYATAVGVTAFLSNDATAVVMTPAVAAMARAVGCEAPLPYLLICAFVANAASFVLPISNPANLVVFGAHMPPLWVWLGRFLVPAVLAVGVTFGVLFATQRRALGVVSVPVERVRLSKAGLRVGLGLVGTAGMLLLASGLGWPLGTPTFGAAVLVWLSAGAPWVAVKHISWSTLLLVAGLFVLVMGLDFIGVSHALAAWARGAPPAVAFWGLGLGLGFGTDLVNNLPAGLLAGHALQGAPVVLQSAALVGVDLGPNLSVTGSLATILWLLALRREGIDISAWAFLRLGALVMPPALLAALLWLWATP